jgi:hypothetical protein
VGQVLEAPDMESIPPGRKPIGPKIRFEVFKRDSFKCQYCGASAPEVLLQVDHVKPIAAGGDDDLLNYLTSCVPCNQGKGARELSDNSVVEKQRDQLEELQARREQLDMMLQWRDGLAGLQAATVEALVKRVQDLTPGWEITDLGRQNVARWLRDYPIGELIGAAERSAVSYLERDKRGAITEASWSTFFSKIPRIAAVERAAAKDPYLRDLLYVRAVLRNHVNFGWWAQRDCMPLLRRAIAAGIEPEELKHLAKQATKWDWFAETLEGWITDATSENSK